MWILIMRIFLINLSYISLMSERYRDRSFMLRKITYTIMNLSMKLIRKREMRAIEMKDAHIIFNVGFYLGLIVGIIVGIMVWYYIITP